MKHLNLLFVIILLIFSFGIISCSSQEYTTAKLAIQQSDFKKAEEWLPKAMSVEPDNPEIPMVMARLKYMLRMRGGLKWFRCLKKP